MPRNPKPRPNARAYKSYSDEQLARAVTAILANEMSLRKTSSEFGIPLGTLSNKVQGKHASKPGRPPVFQEEEELSMVEHLLTLANWGFPFHVTELKHLVKTYLDMQGRLVPVFTNNRPSDDWVSLFLKRHKDTIGKRMCQNIKPARASLSVEEMRNFFAHLKETLTNEDGSMVSMENIFNYDETNLTDDPGSKKGIFRRGVKYPERIMASSKSATSIMFCGSASGHMLPCYVVYKSEHIWSTWMLGGPPHTRYNRSKSGWFDAHCFEDWFEMCFLPHSRRLEGRKVLIGDNLSSHFSSKVIKLAAENNIAFSCLPPNATHLLQPLDVAFFGPLKTSWRKILDSWKGMKRTRTVNKEVFPALLKKLLDSVYINDQYQSSNLVAGFATTGIHPLDENKVIVKIPAPTPNVRGENNFVSQAVIDCLRDMRGNETEGPAKKKRRSKVTVVPGRSISLEEIESSTPSPDSTPDRPTPVNGIIPSSTTSKGKGKGKRSKKSRASASTSQPSTSALASTQQPSTSALASTQQPSALALASTQQPSTSALASTQQPSALALASTQQPSTSALVPTQQPPTSPVIPTQQPSTPAFASDQQPSSSTSCEQQDPFYQCIICHEPYVEPPTEDWIMCEKCHEWIHEACAEFELGADFYVCDLCR